MQNLKSYHIVRYSKLDFHQGIFVSSCKHLFKNQNFMSFFSNICGVHCAVHLYPTDSSYYMRINPTDFTRRNKTLIQISCSLSQESQNVQSSHQDPYFWSTGMEPVLGIIKHERTYLSSVAPCLGGIPCCCGLYWTE